MGCTHPTIVKQAFPDSLLAGEPSRWDQTEFLGWPGPAPRAFQASPAVERS